MKKYRIRTLLVATTVFLFVSFVYASLVQNGSKYVLGVLCILLVTALYGPPIINFEERDDNIDSGGRG